MSAELIAEHRRHVENALRGGLDVPEEVLADYPGLREAVALSMADLPERIEEAAAATDTDPTEGRRAAGNYAKGKVSVHGLPVSIETPKGAERSGKDASGKPWFVTMACHYGYIRRTEGADSDAVDVFLGPHPESELVFVVDQVKPDGSFDEHKVCLGFRNEQEARAGYLACYSAGWKGLGGITPMTLPAFKEWLECGDTGRPLAEQAAALSLSDDLIEAARREARAMVAAVLGDEPVALSQTQHAPAGGVTIAGTFYPGGEFIPSAELAKATPEVRAMVGHRGADNTSMNRDKKSWEHTSVDWDAAYKVGRHPELADIAPEAISAAGAWQGDACNEHVVDDSGSPKVFFHGSHADAIKGAFTFDLGKHDFGHGVYLTTDPGYASLYAHNKAGGLQEAEGGLTYRDMRANGIIPVVARAQNTFVPEEATLKVLDEAMEAMGVAPLSDYHKRVSGDAIADLVDEVRKHTAAFTAWCKSRGFDSVLTQSHETGGGSEGSGQIVLVIFDGRDVVPVESLMVDP